MLLRYLSPLILFCILCGCKPKIVEPEPDKLHKVSVLSLFKPKYAEIIFSENVCAQTEDNHFVPIVKDDLIVIEYINSHLILKINNKSYTTTGIIFYTMNKNLLYDKFQINIPDKINRRYYGGLEIRSGGNEINLILLQKTEDLVHGVLSSESNDDKPEYLKALSIIIRTYIFFNHNRHSNEGFDFCDNTHCMVFYGEQNKNNLYFAAVNSTKGEILKYNNQLIDVYFTGSCGGITKSPTEIWNNYRSVYPYSSIKCEYCNPARHKDWVWSTSKLQFLKLFQDSRNIDSITSVSSFNSPETITIHTRQGNIYLTKDELRLRVGRFFGWNKIYSDTYSFLVKNDSIFFDGHGFGHCIGFCQSGAEEMSRQGKSYKEILLYYYPKTAL